MTYLLDTNILLRSVQTSHSTHLLVVRALTTLTLRGESLCLMPQNVREFWNVATRPAEKNGLGFTHTQAEAEVLRIESLFPVVEDGLAVYQVWRQMVLTHRVSGVQVHDAYLAAAMIVHGIPNLLTFNGTDFSRYGVNVVDPATV